MNYIKNLKVRHVAWAFVLGIVSVWWPSFVIATPPDFLQENIDPVVLIVCMVVALIGGIVKIFGYLASQMPGKVGTLGVSVELVGLILAAVGPLSYIAVSLYGFWEPGVDVNFSSAFILACGVAAIFLYRAIIIVPRFIFEAHDPAKDDA